MRIDPDIMSLDLECISYKVCRDEGWSLAIVDTVELEYRAFLQVVRNCKGDSNVAPTLRIDRFWHHHILDTNRYMADCDLLFGYYLHHFPYSGVFGEDDAEIQRDRVSETQRHLNAILSNHTPQRRF